MAFRFPALPYELQLQVLKNLDIASLAGIRRANKDSSAKTVYILWREIGFEPQYRGDNRRQSQFLSISDRLMVQRIESWRELAACVRSLKIERIQGNTCTVRATANGSP